MGELIVHGIKIALFISLGLALFVAIGTIISLVNDLVLGSVIGEVLGIISCCLPFNAIGVINGINAVNAAILSFMIAHKIWSLSSSKLSV